MRPGKRNASDLDGRHRAPGWRVATHAVPYISRAPTPLRRAVRGAGECVDLRTGAPARRQTRIRVFPARSDDLFHDSRSPLFSTLIATQLRFWSEPLDKARRDGIINPKLNNRHIAEWHLSALYLLVVRVDRSEAEQRFLVENLLIPSLLRRTKG
jgi:hypothetical protein